MVCRRLGRPKPVLACFVWFAEGLCTVYKARGGFHNLLEAMPLAVPRAVPLDVPPRWFCAPCL